MSAEKMREEFEAWWVSRPFRKKPETYPDGTYKAPAVMIAWGAWHASRAALVVELPSEQVEPALPLGHPDKQWPLGWNTALGECRAAVESAGVRVKA